VCPYCALGLKIEKDLVNFSKTIDSNIVIFELDKFAMLFRENKEISDEINKLKLIDFHKKNAFRQKNTYHRFRTEPEFLGDQTILIDTDWKQKIYYGKNSPRQQTQEFYNNGSCSLLSFGIYYTDTYKNKINSKNEIFINCLNIDILCENTSQKAVDFINCFRFIRKLEAFKKIEKQKYIIFTDTAKSFRNAEVCYYLFKELAMDDISVSLNFFGEYHGKVSRF
jgi:hypothetical protein